MQLMNSLTARLRERKQENQTTAKFNIVKHVGISLVLAVLLMGAAQASTVQMDTTLVRINTLLGQVNPLINLAAKQQDPNARVQFQFSALRKDVAKIQAGINQALGRIVIQPRVVSPLVGDYLPSSSTQTVQHNQAGGT